MQTESLDASHVYRLDLEHGEAMKLYPNAREEEEKPGVSASFSFLSSRPPRN